MPGHQQRGADRVADEGRGDSLRSFALMTLACGLAPNSATAVVTSEPGCTLNWPAVITRSPGDSPSSTTERPSIDRVTLILRSSALFSWLTA